jgi:hypothetical protein
MEDMEPNPSEPIVGVGPDESCRTGVEGVGVAGVLTPDLRNGTPAMDRLGEAHCCEYCE